MLDGPRSLALPRDPPQPLRHAHPGPFRRALNRPLLGGRDAELDHDAGRQNCGSLPSDLAL